MTAPLYPPVPARGRVAYRALTDGEVNCHRNHYFKNEQTCNNTHTHGDAFLKKAPKNTNPVPIVISPNLFFIGHVLKCYAHKVYPVIRMRKVSSVCAQVKCLVRAIGFRMVVLSQPTVAIKGVSAVWVNKCRPLPSKV